MTDPDPPRDDPGGEAPARPERQPRSRSREPRGEGPAGRRESGAWGTLALTLLVVLFVLAAAATAHSVLVTF